MLGSESWVLEHGMREVEYLLSPPYAVPLKDSFGFWVVGKGFGMLGVKDFRV